MKILIVRVGALGDVLHALPAAAALKLAHPEAQIDWVVDERWRALVTDGDLPGPLVTRSYPVPVRAWKAAPFSRATLGSLIAFRKLRNQYDYVLDMQGTLRSALIGRLAGGRKLSGFADPREPFAASFYAHKLSRIGTHVVEQGTNLLSAALGLDLQPATPQLPRIEWAERWAEQEAVLRRPLALLAVGGGWGAKRWPPQHFGALAPLLRGLGYDVVVNAPSKDAPEALAVTAASHGSARMVVCNVAGMVALMRRTDLCIGGDSGPTHLAAALAVPTVALFGPTSPERNGPWGPGPKLILRDPASSTTYKRTAEVDPGLARITPEQVLQAVESVAGPSSWRSRQ